MRPSILRTLGICGLLLGSAALFGPLPMKAHAGVGTLAKKLAKTNKLVIVLRGEKTAIVKDPKVIQLFANKFATHRFDEKGIGAVHAGEFTFRQDNEVLHRNHFISQSCLQDTVLRREFFKTIDKLFKSNPPTKADLLGLLEFGDYESHIEASLRAVDSNYPTTLIQAMRKTPNLDAVDQSAAALTASILKGGTAANRKAVLDSLIKASQAKDKAERRRALMGLSNFGPEAGPAIKKALSDKSLEIQTAAFYALGKVQVEPSVEAVIQALKVKDYERRLNSFVFGAIEATQNKKFVAAFINNVFEKGNEHDYYSAAKITARLTGINTNLKHFHIGADFDRAKQKSTVALWKNWLQKQK